MNIIWEEYVISYHVHKPTGANFFFCLNGEMFNLPVFLYIWIMEYEYYFNCLLHFGFLVNFQFNNLSPGQDIVIY